MLINAFIALFGIAHAQHLAYAGVLERVATTVEAIWGLLLLGRLWSGVPFLASASAGGERSPVQWRMELPRGSHG